MNKKFSVTIIGIAITASCCLSVHAQDLKTMLLKPANGWVIEWSNPDTRNSGVTEAMFVDRGKGSWQSSISPRQVHTPAVL